MRALISSLYKPKKNVRSQESTLKSLDVVSLGEKPIHSINVLGKENIFFIVVSGLKELFSDWSR